MRWTPELDGRIAGLLRAHKSASEIGAELGVSRNSVIGRVTRCKELHEIGFARAPGEKTTGERRKSIAVSSKKRRGQRGGIVSKNRLKPAPVIVKAAPVLPPQTSGVSLMDLGPRQCRFCINEPEPRQGGHLFCGEVTELGKSWCAWHERIVWGRGSVSAHFSTGTIEVDGCTCKNCEVAVATALSSAYQRGREDAALVAENCVPYGIHPDDLYRWRQTADTIATAIRTEKDKD